jgi:DNA-binding CsgD family transcriptional regulator
MAPLIGSSFAPIYAAETSPPAASPVARHTRALKQEGRTMFPRRRQIRPGESTVYAIVLVGAIAEELVISSTTVAIHIQRVLAKLGVHSRAQAVSLAHQHGLVDADVEAHADPATPITAA